MGCLFVCLFVYLFIYLFIYLLIYLFNFFFIIIFFVIELIKEVAVMSKCFLMCQVHFYVLFCFQCSGISYGKEAQQI